LLENKLLKYIIVGHVKIYYWRACRAACVTLSPIISFLFPPTLTLLQNEIISIFNSNCEPQRIGFCEPQDLNIYYTLRTANCSPYLSQRSAFPCGTATFFPSHSNNPANRNLFLSHQYYFLRREEMICVFVRGNIIIFTSALRWRVKKNGFRPCEYSIYEQLILRAIFGNGE